MAKSGDLKYMKCSSSTCKGQKTSWTYDSGNLVRSAGWVCASCGKKVKT